MPLTTPSTVDEVIDRVTNDIFLSLSAYGAKPWLSNSWLRAFAVAYSNRVFDFYFALDAATKEVFPDTAVENLDRLAAIYGITRTAGNQSQGGAVATGVAGSVIPAGTIFAQGDGTKYVTVQEATLATVTPGVSQIIRAGIFVFLETIAPHGITTNNVKITVSGCVEEEYNGDHRVLLISSPTVLVYAVLGNPSTPATGTPVVVYDTATLALKSEAFSSDADLGLDDTLFIQSPIVGVDDVINIDSAGLTGGLDIETDDSLRARLLDRMHNPVAHFNVADITALAKTLAGVTRVWVYEITPALGMVTVYFMRDNDATPVPDSSEIADLKNLLDTIRPANTDPDELLVYAPTAVPINFVFTSVVPNTSTMKSSVLANLVAFFDERTEVGENITSDAYRSAIYNTVDISDGSVLESFTLSEPIGDQSISEGQIGTLGNVTGL